MRYTLISGFLLLLSFGQILQAQDYQTFRSDRRYSYGPGLHVGFRTVSVVGSDSVFRTYDNIWKNDSLDCWNTIDGSFIGKHVIIKQNGFDVFLNKYGDSIYIKKDARLNESWLMHEADTALFIATVIKHDTLGFLGVTDSVKTIEMLVYDKALNRIGHRLFDKPDILKLSKNYGLIKTPAFRVFPWYDIIFEPDYPLSYGAIAARARGLSGITNPSLGFQDLGTLDVYDFQVGDEIHVHEHTYSWYSGSGSQSGNKKIRFNYIQRTQINPRTIEYKVLVRKRNVRRKDDLVIENSYYEKIEKHKYYASGGLDQPAYTSVGGNYFMLGKDGSTKTNIPDGQHPSGNGPCTSFPIVHYCNPAYEYRKGLGGPYYECSDYTYGDVRQSRSLVYYKKGIETWGTPFTNVGIEEYSSKKLQLFPNPTNEQLYLSLTDKQLIQNATIEIYDLSGRLLQRQEESNISENSTLSIDVSQLAPGSYLLRLISFEESLLGRFEVR